MTATADILVNRLENATLIDNAALRFSPSEKELSTYSSEKKGFFNKIFSRSSKSQTKEKETETTKAKDAKTKEVWTLRENILVPIPITTGLTDGIVTEVTGGDLKTGTQVIIGTESGTK
jgi:HlyD family secretion protein